MLTRRNSTLSFAGREFDESLLAALPDGVDPCGEKGEFHSFVYAGPMLMLISLYRSARASCAINLYLPI